MANYYNVEYNDEKITQEVAEKIFARLVDSCRIRHFEFCEGKINYNTRGLVDVDDILDDYGIEVETNVVDEFKLIEEGAIKTDL